MTKMHAVAGGAVALLLAGTSAWGGSKQTIEVVIDTAFSTASGAVGAARASTDSVQEIGCYVAGSDLAPPILSCWAKEADGTYVSCTSTSAYLLQIASTLSDSSFIAFQWDTSGKCFSLAVYNTSYDAPKEP